MTASAVLLGITGSIRWLHFAILLAVLCHYYHLVSVACFLTNKYCLFYCRIKLLPQCIKKLLLSRTKNPNLFT